MFKPFVGGDVWFLAGLVYGGTGSGVTHTAEQPL